MDKRPESVEALEIGLCDRCIAYNPDKPLTEQKHCHATTRRYDPSLCQMLHIPFQFIEKLEKLRRS